MVFVGPFAGNGAGTGFDTREGLFGRAPEASVYEAAAAAAADGALVEALRLGGILKIKVVVNGVRWCETRGASGYNV